MLTLTPSGESGTGAVTYGVTNTGTAGCWITGDQLHASRTGTCTLTVTQAANASYLVASSAATMVRRRAAPVPFVTTHVNGVVRVGRTVLVSIVGSGFYNKPTIRSNDARTSAVVIHDHGTQLVVRVRLLAGSATGWHVFTVTLANGRVSRVRYVVR